VNREGGIREEKSAQSSFLVSLSPASRSHLLPFPIRAPKQPLAVLIMSASPLAVVAAGRGLRAIEGLVPVATAGAAAAAATATVAAPPLDAKKATTAGWLQHAAHGATRLLVHSTEMEAEAARRAVLAAAASADGQR